MNEPGVYGLLGTNGAGKTTTIRMILGIIKKDSGEITWNGKTVERKHVNFGYLPEERKRCPTGTHLGVCSKGLSGYFSFAGNAKGRHLPHRWCMWCTIRICMALSTQWRGWIKRFMCGRCMCFAIERNAFTSIIITPLQSVSAGRNHAHFWRQVFYHWWYRRCYEAWVRFRFTVAVLQCAKRCAFLRSFS